MSLENLCQSLEELDGIELATQETDDPKGVILHLTLSATAEGNGDAILNTVLDEIPRDFLGNQFNPETNTAVYYDAIEIEL